MVLAYSLLKRPIGPNANPMIWLNKKNSLKTKNLISHRFDFEKIKDAYKLLLSKEISLGILIQYQNKQLETSNI